jgi:hypothetical protein
VTASVRPLPEPPMEGTGLIELPSNYDLPTLLRAWAVRLDAMERSAEDGADRMGVRLDAMEKRLEDGDTRMGQIEQSLKQNTESTQRVEKNTGDLVEAFNSLKGGFKVLQILGKVAAPVGAIIGAGVAAWAAFKGGR